MTGCCLAISLVGIVCHYTGCRNPRNTYLKEKRVNKALLKQQLEFGMEYGLDVAANDDYVSVSMMDHIAGSDGNSQRLFASARLMPQISVPMLKSAPLPEHEMETASAVYSKYEASSRSFEAKHEKDYEKMRKKRFLREHL